MPMMNDFLEKSPIKSGFFKEEDKDFIRDYLNS